MSNIHHPSHYGGDTPYEAIKVIEAWNLGFHLGNAVKYIKRAGSKPGHPIVEDLRKAMWYIDREITRLVREELKGDTEDGFSIKFPGPNGEVPASGLRLAVRHPAPAEEVSLPSVPATGSAAAKRRIVFETLQHEFDGVLPDEGRGTAGEEAAAGEGQIGAQELLHSGIVERPDEKLPFG